MMKIVYETKNIEKQISINKPEKRKKINKNESQEQKTNITFFEIYVDATVGWGRAFIQ